MRSMAILFAFSGGKYLLNGRALLVPYRDDHLTNVNTCFSCLFSAVLFALYRIRDINAMTNIVTVEYHGAELTVHAGLLGQLGQLRPGTLFQFLGELERENGKVCLPCSSLNSNICILEESF